jgi:phosphatidylglycerophosphate synthase
MASVHSDQARPPVTELRAPSRPRELEDWLNYRIYHPLAGRLAAALSHTPVTPNMISVVSGLSVVAAGALYLGLDWPLSAGLGLLVHCAWHVLDGADGDLARMTGKVSPFGEMIDGISDYLSHFLLYTAFGLTMAGEYGLWGWLVPLLAGLSRILQSSHAESQRRIYKWRVYGTPWLQQARAGKEDVLRRSGFFSPIASAYLALANLLNPPSPAIDRAVEAAAGSHVEQRRLRALCRQGARRSLRLQLWLGANSRTLMLGLAVACGFPLGFFIAECTLFNLLLIWSIAEQRRVDRRLAAHLA